MADDEGALAIGVARLDHLPVRRWPHPVAPRGAQPVVTGQQVVDLAGHLDPGGDEHDEVVADPLEIGDEVRGEDDAHVVLDDDGHEGLEELPAGQRVEAGDRFVEDQQLGPLGDGQGEGQLGPLSTRERARLLPEVEPELLDPLLGERLVPSRVDPAPEP